VHPTCGSLRDLGAFFWLRVFPAPKQSPRSAHTRVTQTVGRQEENASGLFESEGVLLQPARTHSASGRNRKYPKIGGGAECASGMPAHKPAPQLQRTRHAGHANLPTHNIFLIRALQMFRSG
jgi:hypothetical protein